MTLHCAAIRLKFVNVQCSSSFKLCDLFWRLGDRGHIDKPISAYVYQLPRKNELRKTLVLVVVYS